MITARDKSWRYLGPPRTGSTTLSEVLRQPPYRGQYSGAQHDMEPLPGARIIVSVRSPWTRAVSLWGHYRMDLGRKQGRVMHNPPRIRPIRAEELPFKQFMQECLKGDIDPFVAFNLDRWLRFIPEWHFRIRQESLTDDLRACFPELEMPEVFRVNPSLIQVPADLYDDEETVELVRKWAGKDFLIFNYPDEPPRPFKL